MPRQALQPRDARGQVQRQDRRRHPRHAHQRGCRVLQGVPGDLTVSGHPCTGGTGLHPFGAARHHTVGRRIAARQARDRTATPFHRQDRVHPRRADDRPALRRREQTARGAARTGGQRQHSHRDRAQPGRGQIQRLDHRPGSGRRRRRRHNRGRGNPEHVVQCDESWTGRFLSPLLK